MALRVLLADESTTIKKVMQLALQDFAVEVKAVHAGVDVLEVGRSFQPDIIFADVLLPKKSGYEVCADLKADAQISKIPVVLMWSSFMDLDEKAFAQCKADGRLEKPFDVENLRSVIQEFVPKTQTQKLAHFLRFPDSFVDPLANEVDQMRARRTPEPAIPQAPPEAAPVAVPSTSAAVPPAPAAKQPPPPPPPLTPPPIEENPPSSDWSMDSFEDINDFQTSVFGTDDDADEVREESFSQIRLTSLKRPVEDRTRSTPASTSENEEAEEPWSHQDLAQFKIDVPTEDPDTKDFPLEVDISEDEISDADFLRAKASKSKTSASLKGGASETTSTGTRLHLDPSSETAGFELELDDLQLETEPPIELTVFHQDPMTQDGRTPSTPLEVEFDDELTPTADGISSQNVSVNHDTGAFGSGSVPQLSAEHLEAIIRAQSREIIESVVRRVVPDIASELIRKELERLLSETDGGTSL